MHVFGAYRLKDLGNQKNIYVHRKNVSWAMCLDQGLEESTPWTQRSREPAGTEYELLLKTHVSHLLGELHEKAYLPVKAAKVAGLLKMPS